MKRRSFLKLLGIASAVPVLLNTKDVGGTVMEDSPIHQEERRKEDRRYDVGSRDYLVSFHNTFTPNANDDWLVFGHGGAGGKAHWS